VRSDLDDALDGKPWSFAGVVFGLERIIDDEGRPVSERRAPSSVKDGVEIELRSCPYPDERLGQPMNASALAQLTRHLDSVLAEVARFRAMGPRGTPTWAEVFEAVIDQLVSPARYLLEKRDRRGPVPAQSAVGHKLAAGYFGVLRNLLVREALGDHYPVSVESLLAFVKKQRALIGASEVCAGPPKMITRVSDILIHGMPDSPFCLPLERASMARLFCLQVQVGIAWEAFDLESERRLLVDEIGRDHMRARNLFLKHKLDMRLDELGRAETAEVPPAKLPETLPRESRERLRQVLRAPCEDGSYERASASIGELFACGDGAMDVTLPRADAVVGTSFAKYLVTFREFVRAQWALERELRKLLGFAVDAPVHLHATALPKPKGLGWYEAIVGHSVRSEPSPNSGWILGNRLRTASID